MSKMGAKGIWLSYLLNFDMIRTQNFPIMPYPSSFLKRIPKKTTTTILIGSTCRFNTGSWIQEA
jgi:hypothetical protein